MGLGMIEDEGNPAYQERGTSEIGDNLPWT